MKPIKLDSLLIKEPVLLCPLAGITDLPYRMMVKRYGAGMVYSEMISSNALSYNSDKTLKMLRSKPEEKPMGVQIAGSNLSLMQHAARINENLGADLIDINMGCPAKKVVKGIAGSALLQNEKLAGEIMEAVVKAVSIPVTLKIRLGWDSDNINAVRIAKIAEQSGIKMLTVHGRTRQQFFSGKADWTAVSKVKQSVKIPVIVNGDINSPETAEQALKESKADGIMVGRATYGMPWLLKHLIHYLNTGNKLPEPTLKEREDICIAHYEDILAFYGLEKGIKLARKHLSWYTKGLPDSAILRAKINTSVDHNKILQLLKKCFR